MRARKMLFPSFNIAAVTLLLFTLNAGPVTPQPLMQGTHTPFAEFGTTTW